MITLRRATIRDRRKTYEWLCLSDITHMCLGAPDYPEHPVPTWEEYEADFEDFYFEEKGRKKGAVLIIQSDGVDVGSICYSCFHLNEGMAELDIWMKSKAECGKGYGVEALKLLILHLYDNLGIRNFLIRPAEKNINAIRAYEKAGFRKVDNKEGVIHEYYNKGYIDIYGKGDYGMAQSSVMIQSL